ncbi:MAG: tetratricopeptide repeat protein, partial [Candidatus Aminicenantia bacterium]
IQLLSEMGLLAIPFLAGIIFLYINLLKNILLSQDRREKGLALAILSFLFNSFFTNSLFYLPVYFILIFLLANLNPFDRGFTITIYLKNLHKIALIFIFLFTLISAGYIPYISNEYFRKGLIVSRVGNIDNGLKKMKIAERLTPLSSDVKNELGRVYKLYYIRTNDPFYLWSSYYELSESLKLNPNQAISHAELAELFTILLKREKNPEAFALAEHHWKEAISLAPFNPFYYFNLSQLYYNHFKNKEAEEVLKKCIELEPNFIMAHYFLYKIYEEMGEVKKREREKQITEDLIKKFGNRNYRSTYFIMLFSVPENVVKEITGEGKLEVK